MIQKTKRVLGSQSATYIVQLLVVVSLLLGVWLTLQQRSLVACQAAYADAQARSSAARTQAAEDDRQALRIVMQTVADGRDARAAARQWLATQSDTDRKRAANPIPESPRGRC